MPIIEFKIEVEFDDMEDDHSRGNLHRILNLLEDIVCNESLYVHDSGWEKIDE